MRYVLFLCLFITGCATADSKKAAKYPHCWHDLRVVFEKCVTLNEGGENINALQTEKRLEADTNH